MSDKPKTFEQWLETSGYGEKEFLKHREYFTPLLNAWNAAIESMQEEIDKRDAIIKKCLSVLRELEDERYGDISWLTFDKAEDLVSEIEELNGVKDD